MKSVAYDVYPYERQIRPHAPANVEFVHWVFYLMILIMVVLVGFNGWRIMRSNARTAEVTAGIASLKHDTDRSISELSAAARRKDVADDIRDWLEMSPSAQELIRLLNEEFARSRVTVRSLSLSRAEGQPLINYSVIFTLPDKKESLKVILDAADQISARFGALGYKTVGVLISVQDTPNTWKIGQTLSVPLKSKIRPTS